MPQRDPSIRADKPPPARHASSYSARTGPQRHASSRSARTAPPQRNPSVRTANSAGASVLRRPPTNGFQRTNTLQTRYMEMLLALDQIPRLHNILAAFFGWFVLAGFVVFPGTFTSLQEELATNPAQSSSSSSPTATALLLHSVQNLPLLIVAAVVCGLGALGLLWLTYRWRSNYVWLLNKIFLPGATNALAGLISTLITVYTQKNGDWSIMAVVTAAVEAGDLVVCGSLFVVSTVMLQWVKRKHGKELERLGKEQGGEEGLLEKAGRKLQEPAVEPQSVV